MHTLSGSRQAEWAPYCGEAPGPAHWLLHWNWDPILLAMLGMMLLWSLSRRRGVGLSHVGVVALLFVLFVTPLCAVGSALFLARSVHHLVLAIILAPLVVTAIGPRLFPHAKLTAATVAQTVIFWAWHLPGLYEFAMSSDLVFWVMQISITVSACVWWAALRRGAPLEAAAALLAQMVQMGVLGALLVFAGRAFYAPHWLTTTEWGLTPLEDQQVAGLIMWVAGGGIYLLIAMSSLWRALTPDAQTRAA